MNRPPAPNPYKRHRFPAEIISHGVWLYFRFCLSYRDVEELMATRGVILTYEAVRSWCRKFGQAYANALRRRRPRPGDTWHLDEVFLTICGERHYLWRAVDQNGHVLDILVQRRRDKQAAKKFFRKLLKGW
jgi:putative transposase